MAGRARKMMREHFIQLAHTTHLRLKKMGVADWLWGNRPWARAFTTIHAVHGVGAGVTHDSASTGADGCVSSRLSRCNW